MKRLFTFGDSFSQYAWPMWPSILGQSFEQTYNYGRAGTGNFFTFYKAMQCLIEQTVNGNDVVIIQWTSPTRFDILYDNYWSQMGDATAKIFRDNNTEYLNSDQMCVIKQLTYMNSIAKILDSIGCKWHFMFLNKFAMAHSRSHGNDFGINWTGHIAESSYYSLQNNLTQYNHKFVSQPISDFVDQRYAPDPWAMKCSYNDSEQGFIEFIDCHPMPSQTMQWINDYVLPVISELNIPAMTDYSNHCNAELVNASKQDGKFNLYHPHIIAQRFEDFNLNNNYKFITNV